MTDVPTAAGGANPPVQTYGIEDLKQLATAVAHVAGAMDGVFADGKVNVADAVQIPALLKSFQEFYGLNWATVLPEAGDLSVPEAEDLAAHFKAVFNLNEDGVEAVIENGITIVLKVVEAFQEIWNAVQTIKGKIA